MTEKDKTTRYRAEVGVNFADGKGGEVRFEAGQTFPESRLPSRVRSRKALAWFLENGYITEIGEGD